MTGMETISIRDAVDVATDITVYPSELGQWVAGQDSAWQARFLFGLAHGFDELDPSARGKQLLYIRDDLGRLDPAVQQRTHAFIADLAEYVGRWPARREGIA